MFALFALGGIGFWALLALETIILLALIEFERPWFGSLSIIVTGVLLNVLCGVNIVTLAVQNPGLAGIFAGLYFVAGTIWSGVKWFLFVLKKREEFVAAKEAWDPQSEAKESWDNKKEKYIKSDPPTWEESRTRARFVNSKGTLAPLVRENKERVMLWMVYWPFSTVWTIINDPIKRLFKHIFNLVQDTFQGISNRVFADLK